MLILILILLCWLIWISSSTVSEASDQRVLCERNSPYQQISVVQTGNLRYLRFKNSNQSALDLDDPLRMVFPYTSYLHLGVVAHPQPTKVLFIGLGGGSAPRKFLHDYPSLTAVDAVEIDPEVVKIARTYFALPDDPRFKVSIADGRLFVEESGPAIAAGRTDPYDLVIIDAYTASSIPHHLITFEFLRAVRKILSPDGVVVANLIGALSGPHCRFFHSMARTYGVVFPQKYLFPVGGWTGESDIAVRNIILIATLTPEKWEKKVWQKQAASCYGQKLIREEVPVFVDTLVDETALRTTAWFDDLPVLTDDHVPYDPRYHRL
jgi:spermidine synthase